MSKIFGIFILPLFSILYSQTSIENFACSLDGKGTQFVKYEYSPIHYDTSYQVKKTDSNLVISTDTVYWTYTYKTDTLIGTTGGRGYGVFRVPISYTLVQSNNLPCQVEYSGGFDPGDTNYNKPRTAVMSGVGIKDTVFMTNDTALDLLESPYRTKQLVMKVSWGDSQNYIWAFGMIWSIEFYNAMLLYNAQKTKVTKNEVRLVNVNSVSKTFDMSDLLGRMINKSKRPETQIYILNSNKNLTIKN